MALWSVLQAFNNTERDVVVLPIQGKPTRKQAFYLSSGVSSERAGTWLPFQGIVDCLVWSSSAGRWLYRPWYDKRAFTNTRSIALERFGSVELARASWRLGGGIWNSRKGEGIARSLHLVPSERGADIDCLVYPESEQDTSDTEEEEEEDVPSTVDTQRTINALINPALEDFRVTSSPLGLVSVIDFELVQLGPTAICDEDRAQAQLMCDALEGKKDVALTVVTTYQTYFSARKRHIFSSSSTYFETDAAKDGKLGQ